MVIWTTSNEVYTHSTKFGIIKGQKWSPKEVGMGLGGEVVGITVKGYVILDHAPKLVGNSHIEIRDFLRRFKLTQAVTLKAHEQHGVTKIQAFRAVQGQMTARATLKGDFVAPKCNCRCHYDKVLHIFGCCDQTYRKYPVFDQSKR